MKKLLLAAVASVALALPTQAAYYLAGDFNGWNASGNAMTDLGGGLWSANLTGVGGRHEFKVTIGDWSQNWPGSGNSWFFGDGSGNVTITYDANTYTDGWSPASGRIGVNVDPGAWTAVGNWQGWNNANPLTPMTAMGGGVYELTYQITTPGWYEYKAVNTGSWDAIGSDSRGINAATLAFEVMSGYDWILFSVDALDGSIKVSAIPEPSTCALLGIALTGFLCLRRRQ